MVSASRMVCWPHGMTWWRNQMESFSALLALCEGNSPITGEFPSQWTVTLSFDVFFDLCLDNGWANNRDTGDFRRHRPHYVVIVMTMLSALLVLCVGNLVVVSLTNNAKPRCFLWRNPEESVEQTIKLPVIGTAMTLMWSQCDVFGNSLSASSKFLWSSWKRSSEFF